MTDEPKCENCAPGYDCEHGIYVRNEDDGYPLYSADPNCDHRIVLLWSGYKCANCRGWFCL